MPTPRTPEEAVVEWKFAKEERNRLARVALSANIAEFNAQEAVDLLENYLAEQCPGIKFDLGDGTFALVREIGRSSPKVITI